MVVSFQSLQLRLVSLTSLLRLLCCLTCLQQQQQQMCNGQPIFHSSDTWSVTDLSIVSISSPQCQSTSSGAAWSCVLPATLTVVTTAVPASVSSSPFSAFVFNVRYLPSLEMSLPIALEPASNTTWRCSLLLPGYVRPAFNVSLAVSMTSAFDYTKASSVFNGLSILGSPPPLLSSIAGCTGSGRSTTG